MALVNLVGAVVPRAIDTNGDTESGALLYVYKAGTTTEVTTYADINGVTANAHPVVSGAGGSWGDIYVEPQVLKVDIRTSGGVSLPGYPIDNIIVANTSLESFADKADVQAASFGATIEYVRTANPPALWKFSATEPSHEAKIQSADSKWWEYAPERGVVDATVFDLSETGTEAANGTALTNFAAYLNENANYQEAKIPAGQYLTDGGFALNTSRIHLDMRGAALGTSQSSGVVIDMFGDAVPAETTAQSYQTIEGGRIYHQTAQAATPTNTVTGVRFRSTTRCAIRDVEFRDLYVGIDVNHKESLLIENCNGFKNYHNVRVEDWQTGTQNPQNWSMKECGWSTSYGESIYMLGTVNLVQMTGGFIIGTPGVVLENASSVGNNSGLHIENVDFEQGEVIALSGTWTLGTGSATITGTSGAATTEIAANDRIATPGGYTYTVSSITDNDTIVLATNPTANESNVTIYEAAPYIDVRDTNSGKFRNLVIEGCRFSGFTDTGIGNTNAYVLHCRDVDGVTFANTSLANVAPGWMWLDSSCENIGLGRMDKAGTDNLIHFDCGREEITCTPEHIDFPAFNGSNGNLLFNNTAVSDGDSVTIDMSGQIASGYWPWFLPPKGYLGTIAARDNASAAAAAGACHAALMPDSGTAEGERFRYVAADCAGHTNDRFLKDSGYIPADDNGDIYAQIDATGADTMDLYATIQRMCM